MNKMSLHYIKNWLKNTSHDKLHTIVKSLDQETYDKLFWSIMNRDLSKEFNFSMKEYMSDWKLEFDNRYTSLDRELIEERLDKTKDNVDIELSKEYYYLQYWYDKETEVGGLFNFY